MHYHGLPCNTMHYRTRVLPVSGLGAVLAQEQADGQVHPIAFSSRSLSVHERNYGITELETLGLVWAVKIFRPYILGHRCVVLTDHAACTSLLGSTNPSSKLARWAMAIQELDLDIQIAQARPTVLLMLCPGILYLLAAFFM